MTVVSCSKNDTEASQGSTYNLVSNETLPGEAVEIKSNKPITESEISVMIDDKPVKAYANGEYSYVFITPVLASGNYNLKFSVVNKDITLNLKVNNYVAITKPEEVISDFVVNRDKCFDAIKETGSSLETLILIDQIKEEWDFQYSKNTIEDKLLLAYIVQKNNLNPDWFNTSSKYPENYYSKSNFFVPDAGEKLVTTAKEFITAQNICLASIPALVGTGTLFLSAPNFVTGGIFIATFTVFVVSREVAIQKAKEVGSLKGVAEAVSDVSYQKIAALELVKDTDTDITMKINFRNLKTTDINIQTDITKAFNEEKKFTEEDERVNKLYNNAIKFTEKLKGLYMNHISLIGTTSERNLTTTVLDKDIIVQGSSNTDVKISTGLNGDVRKIKATSTSTVNVNFNLKIAYKRAIDGKEIVKDVPCVFKVKSPLIGTWNLESDNGTAANVWNNDINTICSNIVNGQTKVRGTMIFTPTDFVMDIIYDRINYNPSIDITTCKILLDNPNTTQNDFSPEDYSGTYSVNGSNITFSEIVAYYNTYVIINQNKIDIGGRIFVRQ